MKKFPLFKFFYKERKKKKKHSHHVNFLFVLQNLYPLNLDSTIYTQHQIPKYQIRSSKKHYCGTLKKRWKKKVWII